MQKRTVYSNENITFWPLYAYGKIGIVYVCVTALIAMLPYFLGLFDSSSRTTPWYSILFPLVVSLVSWLILKSIRGVMYQQIVISHLGIEISNAVTNTNERYVWDDITSISFHTDVWFGRRSLQVWLKESPNKRPVAEPLYDIIISMDGLDKNKLLEFIPRDLFRNDPHMTWL